MRPAQRRWIWLFAPVVLCPGCLLTSSHPLGESRQGSIDNRLLGGWTCKDAPSPGDDSDQKLADVPLQITRFDETQYLVEFTVRDDLPVRLRGWTNTVHGHPLATLTKIARFRELEPLPEPYFFARYEFKTRRRLRVDFVKAEVEGLPSAAAIRQQLVSAPADSLLWRATLDCRLTDPWDPHEPGVFGD